MTTQHTLGPYQIHNSHQGIGGTPVICDGEGRLLAELVGHPADRAEDAAFVLRAINSHADLLAALRECADMLRWYHVGDDSEEGQKAQDIEARARAALARAEQS